MLCLVVGYHTAVSKAFLSTQKGHLLLKNGQDWRRLGGVYAHKKSLNYQLDGHPITFIHWTARLARRIPCFYVASQSYGSKRSHVSNRRALLCTACRTTKWCQSQEFSVRRLVPRHFGGWGRASLLVFVTSIVLGWPLPNTVSPQTTQKMLVGAPRSAQQLECWRVSAVFYADLLST